MKIVLFCCSGYSSSMLMKSMQLCMKERNIDFQLEAHAVCESDQAKGCDVILLSPQVRFNLAKIQSLYKDIPVLLISKEDFEKADGESIWNQIHTIIRK